LKNLSEHQIADRQSLPLDHQPGKLIRLRRLTIGEQVDPNTGIYKDHSKLGSGLSVRISSRSPIHPDPRNS
jgi:hypothetical protein